MKIEIEKLRNREIEKSRNRESSRTFLTILMSAEVGLGLETGERLPCLVDGHYAELVPLALAEPGHARLQLVDGGAAVVIVRHEGVEPSAELVLLLDDVVGDGTAAVVQRLVPLQGHRLVVELADARLFGLRGRF